MVSDNIQTIQERIEGILILMRATKEFEDRVTLLRDLRILIDEADQMLLQKPAPQPSLPMIPETSLDK
jgi:hypothetical protein